MAWRRENLNEVQTVWWEPGAVCLIDQTKLPHARETVRCNSVEAVAAAIRELVVRGAPAIGVTAAYGMALAARKSAATYRTGLLDELVRAKKILDASRSTAVNLSWATGRMLGVARKSDPGVVEIAERLLAEAHEIRDEDKRMCRRIGEHGAALLGRGSRVLTHCNAGGLATTGYGTALAPIRMAHEEGKELHVFVDETRPFLQGARLTAWELREAGIPLTLITDSMAAHFMGRGPLAPEGVHAAYPAFDVTPHGLVTAIITERGIVEQAYEKELGRLVQAG